MDESISREEPLNRVLADYLVRTDRGEKIDREVFIAQHPEVADGLRSYFSDADTVEKVLSPGTEPTASFSVDSDIHPPEDIPVPPSLGDYEMIEEIGRGGMGIVYKARQVPLNRIVAVKIIRSRFLSNQTYIDRFHQEAQLAAGLRHPGIVAIHEVGRQGEFHYFSMDYIEGQSLAELIRKEPLPPREAAELIEQIALALHYAHRRGLIHRDIKPANILLDAEGQPHITDFGLALHEQQQRQRAGECCGTRYYMAPEQVRGEAHRLDGRADIWALGAMMYRMLTGRRPFEGNSDQDIFDEILHREPKPPRQIDDRIPARLEEICLRCLAKDPTKRYPTALDLSQALHHWRQPSRFRVGAAWFSLVAAILILAVLALWRPWQRGATPTSTGPDTAASVPASPESPDALKPLSANMSLMIWNPSDPVRNHLYLNDPGVLPLRSGDQIQFGAELTRPAYVYLIWIDSQGQAFPVYPWLGGRWTNRPTDEKPVQYLNLPEQADEGWSMDGSGGMETLVLLAREEKLPRDIDLSRQLIGLPKQPNRNNRSLFWFVNGERIGQNDPTRTPTFMIDESILDMQHILHEKLGPYFTLNLAASFSNRGEEK